MKRATTRTITTFYSALFSLLLLTGCSSTKVSPLASGTNIPASIAVLPVTSETDLPRERLALLRTELESEMRSAGFSLVDSKVVDAVCSTPACPERATLASKYLVDGYASLSVSSFSKNNFLAGYYNSLDGTLSILDRSGKTITTVDHSESERGGLIFSTGQVFQGIISQVKHTGDSVFEQLAGKFSRSLTAQLPKPTVQAAAVSQREGDDVAVTGATVTPVKNGVKICAQGTPGSFATISLGTSKTPLREVAPGEYCALLSSISSLALSSSPFVEIRSAFGQVARRDIEIPLTRPCNLNGLVTAKASAQTEGLTVQCIAVRGISSPVCQSQNVPKDCSIDRVVVFSTETTGRTPKRVGELKTPVGSVSAKGQLIALGVSPSGVPSLPSEIN